MKTALTALLAGAMLALLMPAPAMAAGTGITVRGSEYGRMLFGPNRQAIYIFQRDRRNRSRCYGECAREWPPVYTEGRPRARRGVKRSLLGTTTRRDGRLQVTYAGKPLYYYAHEGPGEVECQREPQRRLLVGDRTERQAAPLVVAYT